MNVEFVSIEDDGKDLVVSFAVSAAEGQIRSLVLQRALHLDWVLDEDERGVAVSYEHEQEADGRPNLLVRCDLRGDIVTVLAQDSEYTLDVRRVPARERRAMGATLHRMNHDEKFALSWPAP